MATLFETFVNLELPQRAVMLTDYNTSGYTGNPNSSVLAKINTAPVGTWFIDAATGDLWQKLVQTDPSSWVLRSSGTAAAPRFRELLVGTINGVNTIFTTTQNFLRTTGYEEWVYYNGQLIRHGASNDYTAQESGGVGTGYDQITTAFAPIAGDVLEILYLPA